jgi:hypothetical protein
VWKQLTTGKIFPPVNGLVVHMDVVEHSWG